MTGPTLAATMTPFPYSIPPGATLHDARAMMDEHGIHHLPVADGDRVLGIIARADLFAAGRLAVDPTQKVEAFADEAVYVVDLHTPLAVVAAEMAERHASAAVITREGKLSGILTHTDLARVVAELLSPSPPSVA